MRAQVLFALAVVVVAASVTASARSGGADSIGWAGSVKGNDGCTCHSGSANGGTQINDLDGWPTSYQPGQTYALVLSSTTDVAQPAAGQNQGGFLAWVSHGTLAASSGSSAWIRSGDVSGVSYVAHGFQGDRENSAQTWSFDWTAPATGAGSAELRVYVNRVNGNGGADSGDHWNKRTFTSTEAPSASSPLTPAPAPTAATSSTPAVPPSTTAPPTEPAPGLVAAAFALVAAVFVVRRRAR